MSRNTTYTTSKNKQLASRHLTERMHCLPPTPPLIQHKTKFGTWVSCSKAPRPLANLKAECSRRSARVKPSMPKMPWETET